MEERINKESQLIACHFLGDCDRDDDCEWLRDRLLQFAQETSEATAKEAADIAGILCIKTNQCTEGWCYLSNEILRLLKPETGERDKQ